MNYHRIVSALKYFLFSRHRKGHGIHSPFVFDIINTVLRKKIPPEVKQIIFKLRKEMQNSEEIVEINDLGAGSVYNSGSHRRLSDIASRSAVTNSYGKVLYNLARLNDGEDILELGTSLGLSTLFIALGAPDSEVVSIEGSEVLAGIAADNFARYNVQNIKLRTGEFTTNLQDLRRTGFKASMIFVDGDHRKEPLLRNFDLLKKIIKPGSVMIFDDINYSSEMNTAWHEIKKDSGVSVSIDIFQMGIVFFREGMVKQDFKIRY